MTIKQLLSFSWMSQASYLDFTGLVQNDPLLKNPCKAYEMYGDNKRSALRRMKIPAYLCHA